MYLNLPLRKEFLLKYLQELICIKEAVVTYDGDYLGHFFSLLNTMTFLKSISSPPHHDTCPHSIQKKKKKLVHPWAKA